MTVQDDANAIATTEATIHTTEAAVTPLLTKLAAAISTLHTQVKKLITDSSLLSTTTPTPAPIPVSTSDGTDGLAAASGGPAQLPNLLTTYAKRPPWSVAGVDFAVGPKLGTVFKNPAISLPPGCSYDAGNHQITCTLNGATISGYDFSNGGGILLMINASNVKVINCKFAFSANTGLDCIRIQGPWTNTYIGYCTIDNSGQAGWDAIITMNGGGGNPTGLTIEYCWLKNAGADVVNSNGGLLSMRYNLIQFLGQLTGSHPDIVQHDPSGLPSTDQIYYNTIYQNQANLVEDAQGFSFGDNLVQVAGSNTCSNNTFVTVGFGYSYLIIPTEQFFQAGASLKVANNFANVITTGGTVPPATCYGFTTVSASTPKVTFNGNINMVNGASLDV